MRSSVRLTCLCLSAVIGLGALGCSGEDKVDPDPLLVPWDRLSGRIAYVRGGQEVMVIDSASRSVRRVYESPHLEIRLEHVAWHPSGNSLVVTQSPIMGLRSLQSIDVRTGAATPLHPAISETYSGSYSAAGKLAFYGGPPAGIYVDGLLGLATPETVSPVSLSAPAWAPDGRTLAVAASVQAPGSLPVFDLYLVDTTTWTFSTLGPKDCEDPSYSPDGGRIAYERTHGSLWYASVPWGVEVHLTAADSIVPSHPAWSPDGTQLVVEGFLDASHPKLYLVDVATGAATQLTAQDGAAPAWIP